MADSGFIAELIKAAKIGQGVGEEFAEGANAMAVKVIPAFEAEEVQPEIKSEENNGDNKQE